MEEVSVFLPVMALVTFLVPLVVGILVLVILWRSMKAQEATARALETMERILAQRLPPPPA